MNIFRILITNFNKISRNSLNNSIAGMSSTPSTNGSASGSKKMKPNEEINQDHIKDFSNFKLTRILSNNTRSKVCFLQGTFNNNENPAIVILEKKPFSEESLEDQNNGYLTNNCSLTKSFINDIYGNYECFPKTDINGKILLLQ